MFLMLKPPGTNVMTASFTNSNSVVGRVLVAIEARKMSVADQNYFFQKGQWLWYNAVGPLRDFDIQFEVDLTHEKVWNLLTIIGDLLNCGRRIDAEEFMLRIFDADIDGVICQM